MNEPKRTPIQLGSTTWRLAVTLALIQITTLALGLGMMHAFTRQTLANDARIAAEVANDDLRGELRNGGTQALIRAISDRLSAPDDRNFVVQLRGPGGTKLAGNLVAWPIAPAPPLHWTIGTLTRSGADRPESIGYLIQPLPGGQSLLTGEVMENQVQLTRTSAQSFAYAMLAGLVIAALASWMILRVLERRIDQFSRAARDVASGRLNTRIALNTDSDAFGRLGIAINAMIERIETLVGELRAVTDSMAHDLRSPVARIRSSLERSFEATRDASARAARWPMRSTRPMAYSGCSIPHLRSAGPKLALAGTSSAHLIWPRCWTIWPRSMVPWPNRKGSKSRSRHLTARWSWRTANCCSARFPT
jgi:HAMP domain-containing protein